MPDVSPEPRSIKHCTASCKSQLSRKLPILAQPGGPLTVCCALQLAGVGLLPFDLPKQDVLLFELSKILTQQSGVFAMDLTQVGLGITHNPSSVGCGEYAALHSMWWLWSRYKMRVYAWFGLQS